MHKLRKEEDVSGVRLGADDDYMVGDVAAEGAAINVLLIIKAAGLQQRHTAYLSWLSSVGWHKVHMGRYFPAVGESCSQVSNLATSASAACLPGTD